MELSEYLELDAVALAQLVKAGHLGPAEPADAALAAAEAAGPHLNALAALYEDSVGSQGAAGRAPSLAGVPILLKDAGLHEAGRCVTFGSRLLAGYEVESDSALMSRLRAAGVISIGRSTCSEMEIAATVETTAYGVTRNPWDPGVTPGGSSGGAAAAVAAGIVPIAHGRDGGGSIRMPAACCGVVGLKPSRGRVSGAPGRIPLGDLVCEFALTRSVRDAAALLDALHGPSPGDSYAIPSPGQGSYAQARLDRPLRIGVLERDLSGGEVDAELRQAVGRAAELCERMGHRLIEVEPRLPYDDYIRATLDLWCVETAIAVGWGAAHTGRAVDLRSLEGLTLAWAERGRSLSGADVGCALDVLNDVSRRLAAVMEQADILLSSTLPVRTPPLGLYDAVEARPATWYYKSPIGRLERTTMVFNCTGQPAISLPLFTAEDGLPIGIHLAARFGGEGTLLGLARALEEALPWADRRPPWGVAALSGLDPRASRPRRSGDG